MGIKRTKWDKVFSDYIRERDHWTCQRCLKTYNKYNQNGRRALHCSHYIGRSNWSTRIEPTNAMALCYGCHRFLGSNPSDHKRLWQSRFSVKERRLLKQRKNTKPNIQKKYVATEENYKRLKNMLKEVSDMNEFDW